LQSGEESLPSLEKFNSTNTHRTLCNVIYTHSLDCQVRTTSNQLLFSKHQKTAVPEIISYVSGLDGMDEKVAYDISLLGTFFVFASL